MTHTTSQKDKGTSNSGSLGVDGGCTAEDEGQEWEGNSSVALKTFKKLGTLLPIHEIKIELQKSGVMP